MAGPGEHVKALVRSHARDDDDAAYSVALQVAAQTQTRLAGRRGDVCCLVSQRRAGDSPAQQRASSPGTPTRMRPKLRPSSAMCGDVRSIGSSHGS